MSSMWEETTTRRRRLPEAREGVEIVTRMSSERKHVDAEHVSPRPVIPKAGTEGNCWGLGRLGTPV
jgi:hypothetical protein